VEVVKLKYFAGLTTTEIASFSALTSAQFGATGTRRACCCTESLYGEQ